MPLIELSHAISDGMITYPGIPGPTITDFLTRAESADHYAEGVTFHIARIDLVANTGTYLDTPAHRYEDGHDLAGLSLDQCADLPGVVVDATAAIGEIVGATFDDAAPASNGALLIRTGWSRHFGTDTYADGHPYIGMDAVERILEIGPRLVGIDSLNIDGTVDGSRPAHSEFLAAGIVIVEHLANLDQLPGRDFRFTAAPPLVSGMGTFPVRAFGVVG